MISDYSGIDFAGCMELDCYTFQVLFRDAFIEHMKQTEAGTAYLEDCYLLQQEKPDREALRRCFSKGGEKGHD